MRLVPIAIWSTSIGFCVDNVFRKLGEERKGQNW